MVTVADVIAQPRLGLVAVYLPKPEAEVRWVATSELIDPAPFLEGAELLLTTGLETVGWRSEWDRYVARLKNVPIAAVGIGSGMTHAVPPRSLIKACERHGVNLIDVPQETAFVAISRRTAQLLEAEEFEATRVTLDLQRKLTAAAMRPQPTSAIVDTLGRLLHGAACMMSGDGSMLVGPLGPVRDALPVHEIEVEIARIRPQGLRAAAALVGPTNTAIHAVGLRNRPTSYLAALTTSRPTDSQRSAITTAVSLLGLVAEQERGRADSRRLLQRTTLHLLLAGESVAAQLVLDVAPDGPRLPTRIRVLRASGPDEAQDEARAQLDSSDLIMGGDEEVCVIVPADRSADVGRELAAAGLSVGVGEAVSPADARRGNHTAALALAQATAASQVVTWEELLREGALTLIDPAKAQAFATSLLGSLDEKQLGTLGCFLRHHGSVLKVADELGVHRNTARNRIESIEAALGGSLDDPQLRVNAWIALQALSATSTWRNAI